MNGDSFQIVTLWSDVLIWILAIVLGWVIRQVSRDPRHARAWARLRDNPLGLAAAFMLLCFALIGLMDSLHFRQRLPDTSASTHDAAPRYAVEVLSVLDIAVADLRLHSEKTYSAPFSAHSFAKESIIGTEGETLGRDFPPLRFPGQHWLGTDKVGQDVLYQVLKSIRTALIIGLVTTLVTLPLSVILGIVAGYFRGWVDDVIQYIYTVLNAIPSVLLIAASVLMMQVVIDTHPQWFSTAAERADVRLLALCFILGMTSWTGLCRLLRGETLKLRELEYIQAARAAGVGHARILLRHVLPNVMHIVVIALVMDFSSLVLAEAVLSYVGIGVDPSMTSFGTMINSARLELGREPVVWWSLTAAFVFMLLMVLAANLLADAVRDAFDPRAA
ncbi:MAG: hypothetical protein RIR18_227 [Pseudomonadota bacterium]|jgi:ABC-type dipeptide/oligopeptide/nickel transport system permease subunit